MSRQEHQARSRDLQVKCAVITVSDTRGPDTDRSGSFIRTALEGADHIVVDYRIVTDDYEQIQRAVFDLAQRADIILINGGTGITERDGTYEAVQDLLEKVMPGFGEIFRILSFEEVGPASMLSRAVAGTFRDTVIFSMPGSTGAVRLAMNKLILPELRHIVWELLR